MLSSVVKVLKAWLPCSAILMLLPLAPASANVAVEDLFMITNVRVASGGQNVDLTSQLITQSMSSLGAPITLGGGVTFTPTNAFKSLALDTDRVILDNTKAQPGIARLGNDSVFSILTSSDLSQKPETVGVTDAIQFDITSILPSNVKTGDMGRMKSSFIQFKTPADQSAEAGLTPLQIAESRAANHLISIPSIDGAHLAQVQDLPFIVAEGEGSDELRANHKIADLFKDVLNGAEEGAVLGSAVAGPVAGMAGALLGAGAAGIVSYDAAAVANAVGDNSPDPIFTQPNCCPYPVTPSPMPAIPEPETYTLMLAGLAIVCAMARRRSLLG